MTTGDIKQCELDTHHARVPGTNSCRCRFRKYKDEEIESYVVKCNRCKESINFTSSNVFPIRLTCPNCGQYLSIEKSERETFVVTTLSKRGYYS
jgi:hypothetical protein